MSKPIFSNEAYRDWLRGKDPEALYDPRSGNDCCIAQYLRFAGVEFAWMGYFVYFPEPIYTRDKEKPLPVAWMRAAVGGREGPQTFGSVLKRLEAIMREPPERSRRSRRRVVFGPR